MSDKEILLQVPLKGVIARMFEEAFEQSGLESRTEYIRTLIREDWFELPADQLIKETVILGKEENENS